MEGCVEFTNVTGDITTTLFVKDGANTGMRTFKIKGNQKVEYWYNTKGEKHREGQPAVTHYDNDGKITKQCYYVDGKRYREGQPAVIYYKDGKVVKHYWYNKKGKIHREGNPAVITYEDGEAIGWSWFKNNFLQLEPMRAKRPDPLPKPAEPTADILARIRKDLAEIEARMAKNAE